MIVVALVSTSVTMAVSATTPTSAEKAHTLRGRFGGVCSLDVVVSMMLGFGGTKKRKEGRGGEVVRSLGVLNFLLVRTRASFPLSIYNGRTG